MSSRRKARESAMQMLFERDFHPRLPSETSRLFWRLNPVDGETRAFAQCLFTHCVEDQERIDIIIRRHARNWKLERMAGVDRNVLRLAVTELLHADTPEAVVLDEAIEISKRYCTEDSSLFVNGILDSVVQELRSAADPASDAVADIDAAPVEETPQNLKDGPA